MTEFTELQTLRDVIRWATSQFNEHNLHFGHGTDSAWDEAVALILHTLYLPHDIHSTALDAKLTLAEKEKIYRLLQRRITERIPTAYLTHEAWFANLSFYIDERVLIPRSPIAELIENHFQPWIDPDNVESILDLCTGSGCIAIATAQAFPNAGVDACDLSEEALAVAKINVLRHHMTDQVTLIHSDLFDSLPQKTYDIIVSNPPYVDEKEMADLPPEYRHEPVLGLAAGKEGLDVVRRILKEARSFLNPHGILVVEVGNSEYALTERFPTVPFTWIEFKRSDGGVFVLTAKELEEIV